MKRPLRERLRMRKRAYVPNTFIGGIAKLGGTGVNAPILTAAELATTLGISVNIIKGFRVVGEDVECRIYSDYTLETAVFGQRLEKEANENITYFYDDGAKVIGIRESAFNNCINFSDFRFSNPQLYLSETCFARTAITEANLSFLQNINFYSNHNCFQYCENLESVDLGDFWLERDDGATASHFRGCVSLKSVNIKINRYGEIFRDAFASGTEFYNEYCISATNYSFALNNKLRKVELPNCEILGDYVFYRGNATKGELEEVILPKVQSMGLRGEEVLGGNFTRNTKLKLVDIRSCKKIHGTNFLNAFVTDGTAILKIHIDILTSESGDVHPDIDYLYNDRNVTIELYDDNGDYVETYDPSPELYAENDACSIGANETESIGAGWSVSDDNEIGLSIASGNNSSWSLKATKIGTDQEDAGSYVILSISGFEPNATYRFSADSRATNAIENGAGQGWIQVEAGSEWLDQAYFDIDTFEWTNKSFECVPLLETASFRLYPSFTTEGSMQNWSCLLDNIIIEKISNPDPDPEPEVFAFPTAYGAGAYTTGGRGGEVVHVTNLNDSGSGSLREALLLTYPRIIVFDVSGRIHLESLLMIPETSSNFTVAGQTAPQGGITISGKPIQMGSSDSGGSACNNAIWRYIRFRNGSYTGVEDVYDHNGFISEGTDGLILDHCSFSFNDDQAITMDSYRGALRNITIQRSIFSENATQIITGLQGTYPRGDMTFINNLFVDASHRTPNIGGGLQWDIINNVYFNWGNRLSNINAGSPKVNNIGNYYKAGDWTSGRTNVVQNVSPTIYTANNYHPTLAPIPAMDDRQFWTDFYNLEVPVSSGFFTTIMLPLLGAIPTIKTASEAYTDVLADVGTNKYLNADGSVGLYIDSFDTTKFSNITNNISSDPQNKVWVQPTLPNNTRPVGFYGTNQHIPSEFLTTRGVGNTLTVHNDLAPSGYTWIEEYLNQVDQ